LASARRFFARRRNLIAFKSSGAKHNERAESSLSGWRLTERILKGDKPAGLPSIYKSCNLKTANALGLTVPPSLLAAPTKRSNKQLVFAIHLSKAQNTLSNH
jgi:hypothetical protein